MSATTDSGHRLMPRSDADVNEQVEVSTCEGVGRWYVQRPARRPRGQLLLGHGAGGGVEAADLVALSDALPAAGVTVARFEQPWRVQGRKVATPPPRLDAAWLDAVPAVREQGVPLVVGGRSAGARVACRTATQLDVQGVLALAFPLHPPGRPDRSRASELPTCPTLIVQGDRDAFGSAGDLATLGGDWELCAIPGADHSFRVARSAPITGTEAMELIVIAVRRWINSVV